jgi:ferredoxin-type protein NapH
MQIIQRLPKISRTQILRYSIMILGILALAPPVGFLVQALGGSMTCGVMCPRMPIGSGFFRAIFSQIAGVLLLLGWLGITFFFGRWMCSHVCAAGSLTEFGSKLLPKAVKIDYNRILDVPIFRYGFFAGYLLLPVLGFASVCCSYCNLSTIPETFGAIFSPEIRAGMLTGSKAISVMMYVGFFGVVAKDGRGHCHMLCPIGAVDSIVAALGARVPFTFRTRVKAQACSGCGACAKSCPTAAITVNAESHLASVDYRRCFQCRLCEDKCPNKAIGISQGIALNPAKQPKQVQVPNELTAD